MRGIIIKNTLSTRTIWHRLTVSTIQDRPLHISLSYLQSENLLRNGIKPELGSGEYIASDMSKPQTDGLRRIRRENDLDE